MKSNELLVPVEPLLVLFNIQPRELCDFFHQFLDLGALLE